MSYKVNINTKKNILILFQDKMELQEVLSILAFSVRKNEKINGMKLKEDSDSILKITKESEFHLDDLLNIILYLDEHAFFPDNMSFQEILAEGTRQFTVQDLFIGTKDGNPSCIASCQKNTFFLYLLKNTHEDIPQQLNATLSVENGQDAFSKIMSLSYNTRSKELQIVLSYTKIKSTTEKITDALLNLGIIGSESRSDFLHNLKKSIMKDILRKEVNTLKSLTSGHGLTVESNSPMRKKSHQIHKFLELMASTLNALEKGKKSIVWSIPDMHEAPKIATKGVEKMLSEFDDFIKVA